jgi:hypothetical protein
MQWTPLLLICVMWLWVFVKSAVENWNPGTLVLPIFSLPIGYWVLKIIHNRLTKPSLEILKKKIIVQTKFGGFKEVNPINEYRVIYSKDFFAFRRGKENDVTVEIGHIKKDEFQKIKEYLNQMPFAKPQFEKTQ